MGGIGGTVQCGLEHGIKVRSGRDQEGDVCRAIDGTNRGRAEE